MRGGLLRLRGRCQALLERRAAEMHQKRNQIFGGTPDSSAAAYSPPPTPIQPHSPAAATAPLQPAPAAVATHASAIESNAAAGSAAPAHAAPATKNPDVPWWQAGAAAEDLPPPPPPPPAMDLPPPPFPVPSMAMVAPAPPAVGAAAGDEAVTSSDEISKFGRLLFTQLLFLGARGGAADSLSW